MILSVLKMLLPIMAGLLLGLMARRRSWVSADGTMAFKTIAAKVLLPVVVLNAFVTAEYSGAAAVVCAAYFAVTVLGMCIGFFLRKRVRSYGTYLPFLLESSEFGMLGYALINMIAPGRGMNWIAMIDLGNTVFFFAIAVPLLHTTEGEGFSAKMLLKNLFSSATFDFMLVGIVIGITGLGAKLHGTAVGELYNSVVEFLSAPLMLMILFYLGSELSFKRELMSAVVKTYFLRLATAAVLGTACILFIFCFTPFEKPLLCALILAFILPPPFGIPIFARLDGERDFVCTLISFSSLMTLVLFTGLAFYATI